MKISIEDSIYPVQLRKIRKPPKQLYLKGNIDLLRTSGIAIIGSRECSEYGKKMAKKFSKELSLKGLTIISGMAIGIDSFAHIRKHRDNREYNSSITKWASKNISKRKYKFI